MQSFNETVTYIDLDPATAKSFLEKQHPNQRPLNNAWVAELGAALTKGDFIASQQTLQFDVNGHFFNGQHTCHAVIKTGLTLCHIKLETGCPAEAFVVADTCHNRTQVNRFKAATGETVAASILSILKVLKANWSAKSANHSIWNDPYQRLAIEMWAAYRPTVEAVWGLTPKGGLRGFEKQPYAGLAAACINASIKHPERKSEIKRFSIICSTGRPPAKEDQALTAPEVSTALRWYRETCDPNFNARDTMKIYRDTSGLLFDCLNGVEAKGIKRYATNPFRDS